MTVTLVAILLCAGVPQEVPSSPDKTGMKWVLPFKAAHRMAETQGRLLVIKPIAFGTDAKGGW
ncbi:MAG: hypothetical protein CMJ83_11225 [Planctomycetes bacterium]|jgi:hypothetical protein|nr:hypothetical protein [Planctomycetota bacterium]